MPNGYSIISDTSISTSRVSFWDDLAMNASLFDKYKIRLTKQIDTHTLRKSKLIIHYSLL